MDPRFPTRDMPRIVTPMRSHLPRPTAAVHFAMLYTRREWIRYAAVGVGLMAVRRAVDVPDAAPTPITVYKTPTCGCCKDWVAHLKKNGFVPTVHDMDDLSDIKRSMGIPRELESCHTALVGRYAIEGHVPADLIRQLIASNSRDIAGLAVPGMVPGSPGMETGVKQPYDVIAFTKTGKTSVFAHR